MGESVIRVLVGDALTRLKELPSESVHCVVTSPAYWGLRDYKVDGQLGLENTVEEYVAHLVEVFREVWRVLRSDGTVWLNLGDTYASTPAGNRTPSFGKQFNGRDMSGVVTSGKKNKLKDSGLKPKDLCLIPSRVVLALQADGWYVRRDIIWAKGSCMPESCIDRCTSSHEYIFHLTKSGDNLYWCHRDGMGTRIRPEPDYRWQRVKPTCKTDELTEPPQEWIQWYERKRPKPPERSTGWRRVNLWDGHDYFYDQEAIREKWLDERPSDIQRAMYGHKKYDSLYTPDVGAKLPTSKICGDPRMGRNKRSVWFMNPKPYPEAHFATFPPELPETCIKAGTSLKGCCSKCGAPWERAIKKDAEYSDDEGGFGEHGSKWYEQDPQSSGHRIQKNANKLRAQGRDHDNPFPKRTTTGWQPTCSCGIEDTVPCTVLDPFAGSGTTGEIAKKLGRNAILIELNPEYETLIRMRTKIGVKTGPIDNAFQTEGGSR